LKSRTYKTCNPCRVKKRTNKKYMKQCQDHAVSKGGECLSKTYKNAKTKMKWKCSEGHEWSAMFDGMKKRNRWCPECGGTKKHTIKVCKDLAISRGGECLSKTYKNTVHILKWRCQEEHEWEASFGNIKNHGSWCPKCAIKINTDKQRLSIEECKEFARSKGGECLSETYKNNQTKIKWKCSEGHEWNAIFVSIKNHGRWCPHCSGNIKHTIEKCKELAISRDGECLSENYKNSHSKLRWRCHEGHEWEAVFASIKHQGSWCPQCSSGRSEQACREIFESNLLEKFPNVRPKFLGGLELDGYCEKLNIAFEYNGIQHYEYIPHFHRKGIEQFHAQQTRDRKKYKLCAERGVKLIIIPYHVGDCYKPQDLETFIVDALWNI